MDHNTNIDITNNFLFFTSNIPSRSFGRTKQNSDIIHLNIAPPSLLTNFFFSDNFVSILKHLFIHKIQPYNNDIVQNYWILSVLCMPLAFAALFTSRISMEVTSIIDQLFFF